MDKDFRGEDKPRGSFRGGGNITWYSCLSRFRRARKYRRHWRKYHARSESDG